MAETHVARYSDLPAFERDAKRRVKQGWRLQSQVTEDGHLNLGRTVAKTVLTGGLGLVFTGPSRTRGRVVAIWER